MIQEDLNISQSWNFSTNNDKGMGTSGIQNNDSINNGQQQFTGTMTQKFKEQELGYETQINRLFLELKKENLKQRDLEKKLGEKNQEVSRVETMGTMFEHLKDEYKTQIVDIKSLKADNAELETKASSIEGNLGGDSKELTKRLDVLEKQYKELCANRDSDIDAYKKDNENKDQLEEQLKKGVSSKTEYEKMTVWQAKKDASLTGLKTEKEGLLYGISDLDSNIKKTQQNISEIDDKFRKQSNVFDFFIIKQLRVLKRIDLIF